MPDSVMVDTNNYTYSQDEYTIFKDTCLEKAEGVHVTFDDVYEEFVAWFVERNPHTREPSRTTFLSNIRIRMGRLEDGGWYNYRIKEAEQNY